MYKLFNEISIISIIFGSIFGYFLGGYDGFLYALITFVITDYITGVMLAIIDKKMSSKIGFRGIFKKILIFVLVGIGNIIDVNLTKSGSTIRTVVIFFYISNEGISILENCISIGLPVPAKLKTVFKQIK